MDSIVRAPETQSQVEPDPAAESATPTRAGPVRRIGEWASGLYHRAMDNIHGVNSRDVGLRYAGLVVGTVVAERLGAKIGVPLGIAACAAGDYIANHVMIRHDEKHDTSSTDVLALQERVLRLEHRLGAHDALGTDRPT